MEDFLNWFITTNVPGAESVAQDWVIIGVVIAVVGAGVIFGFKALRKSMAEIARRKIWTRGDTWLLIVIGVFPILLALFLIWYMSPSFASILDISGLFKGVLFAWLIYLGLMIIGHLISPWRRELI